MKCKRCGEELTEETTAYYHGKPYCRKYCWWKTKYEDQHVSLEELRMILKRNKNKGT